MLSLMVNGVTIRKNHFFRNFGSTFESDGVDVFVHHNIFDETVSMAVDLLGCAGGKPKVYNNLIRAPAPITFHGFGTCNRGDLFAHNNFLSSSVGSAIVVEQNAGNTLDAGANRIGDAFWTECTQSTSDYRLKPGSPCLDTGNPVPELPFNGSKIDVGPFEVFSVSGAEISQNIIRVHFDLRTNGPVQARNLSGWGVNNGRAVTELRTVDGSTIDLMISGAFCLPGESWTLSYDSTTGDVTDSAHIGWLLNQPLHSFQFMTIKNECEHPRSIYQCATVPGLTMALFLIVLHRRRRAT